MNSVRLPGPSPFYPRSWKFMGRWPYTPPKRAENPWKPSSKLYLRDALNRIGEHEVPDWDNTERDARSGFAPPEPPSSYYRSEDEPDKYAIFDESGQQVMVDEEAAKAWWESTKAAVWAEWRAETAAHQRWEAVIEIARNFLAEGRITAEVLTEVGYFFPVPENQWRSTNAPEFFRSGFAKFSNYFGETFLEVDGVILIEDGAIDRLWNLKAEAVRTVRVPTFDEGAFPYLAFLVKAAREMPFSSNSRTGKKAIEGWLRDHWPESLGRPTDSKIGYMATFLRRPEYELGGVHGSSDP